MTPRDQHDTEQMLAGIRDTIPRVWWAVYSGLIAAGFTPGQAFVLLQTYVLAQCSNGVWPPTDTGPTPPPTLE